VPKELYYYYYRVRNYLEVLGESVREVLEELEGELRNYNYMVY
jgi:transcription initiation factor IIE alpha subunit